MSKYIKIPVSMGELIDKITILEIKSSLIKDISKLRFIEEELKLLRKEADRLKKNNPKEVERLDKLKAGLYRTNKRLWNIENDIRVLEKEKNYSTQFIDLARKVYLTNDKRFKLKNKINRLLTYGIKEVKQY